MADAGGGGGTGGRVGRGTGMGRVIAAALVAALAAASARAQGGDLCFPVEGWALVGRWHVGSGARSAREGWAARRGADAAWRRIAPGALLPESAAGTWLRATLEVESRRWREP